MIYAPQNQLATPYNSTIVGRMEQMEKITLSLQGKITLKFGAIVRDKYWNIGRVANSVFNDNVVTIERFNVMLPDDAFSIGDSIVFPV